MVGGEAGSVPELSSWLRCACAPAFLGSSRTASRNAPPTTPPSLPPTKVNRPGFTATCLICSSRALIRRLAVSESASVAGLAGTGMVAAHAVGHEHAVATSLTEPYRECKRQLTPGNICGQAVSAILVGPSILQVDQTHFPSSSSARLEVSGQRTAVSNGILCAASAT